MTVAIGAKIRNGPFNFSSFDTALFSIGTPMLLKNSSERLHPDTCRPKKMCGPDKVSGMPEQVHRDLLCDPIPVHLKSSLRNCWNQNCIFCCKKC